jgi:fused signal recognition particle receptor
MSFFKKLKDRMFRSSDKLGEGLEALVAEPKPPPPPPTPAPLKSLPKNPPKNPA